MNIVTSNRINVTVGGQSFAIPAENINQVLNLLSRLQGIQVQENPSPFIQYKGKSLLNG